MELDEAVATIALLQGQVEALERLLSERDAQLADLKLELLRKEFELARFRRALFGVRSERVAPDELVLPGVDLTPQNDTAASVEPESSSTRKVKEHERTTSSRRRRARLELDPACVTDEHRVIDPETTTCACCGTALVPIGEETSTVIEREPARYRRITTHRRKLACSACKQNGILIAPPPEPPSTGAGPVGATLAVDIVVSHFHDHLPFHRLAAIFQREGLSIDRGTLSRVSARVADLLLPLVAVMEKELVASDDVMGIDGTGIKIFDRPHCARRTIYVRHGQGHVVFRALKTDDAPRVLEGLEHFDGIVVCDAATVHLGTVSVSFGLCIALCNAHARRNFYDARATDRERADHALAFYQEVARVERTLRDRDAAARQRERETQLRPRFDAFHSWLIEERPKLWPRTPMAEAFDYVLRHWEGLTRFLTDGRIPWTNNESERLLRHVVVGRNAWIFRGSFEGAEHGCVLWSLMLSCHRLGINPRQYLLDTLEALRTTPHSRLSELTPREYARRRRELATAA